MSSIAQIALLSLATTALAAPTTFHMANSTASNITTTPPHPANSTAPHNATALHAAGSASSFTGDITYYEPGLGACGQTNSGSDHVVALSPSQYDASKCGQTITVTKDGKTASATVVDKCPGCASGSIDVSETVFEVLADLSVGRTTVSWVFE